RNLSIKTTRTKEGRIQNIWAVSFGNHNDDFIRIKTVHFNKQLVQGLFTFIMSSTTSCATLTSNSITLINKYNRWCILLCIFKQLSYSSGPNTNEYFNTVRTINSKERCTSFTCNCFC